MNEENPGKSAALVNCSSGATGLVEIQHNLKKLGPKFGLNFLTDTISLNSLVGAGGHNLGTLGSKFYNSIAQKINQLEAEVIIFLGGRGTARILEEISGQVKKSYALIPFTVENDLWGCESSIGFSSALEYARKLFLESAKTEEDIFILEVAGRESGFLSLEVGLALGAQSIIFSENPESPDEIAKKFKLRAAKGAGEYLLIVNEGINPGRAFDLAENLRKLHGLNTQVAIIAPLQRRCEISAGDFLLAAKYAAKCCEYLAQGRSGVMVGLSGGKFGAIALANVAQEVKKPSAGLLRLSRELYT